MGVPRREANCSTAWCVGPSSPRPMESWVKTKIDGSGLGHLGKLQKLEYLNLYDTAVADEGLKKLATLATRPGSPPLSIQRSSPAM